MLFGLAAKNGILIVDFANRARRDGMQKVDAIYDAAKRRFKPIVMTTSAMILGSLPLALGFAEGGAFRQSMGIVLIGGLISSLLLTLILIPVVYATAVRENSRRPGPVLDLALPLSGVADGHAAVDTRQAEITVFCRRPVKVSSRKE
jgi:Cu/Ag efflux pump CusA